MRRDTDKIVPFDIEAEEAVLGSCILGGEPTVGDVAGILKPGDFYRETDAWIFDAILRLYDRRDAIDFLTVRNEVERMGRLDAIGGAAFLASLINVVPTAVHAEHYAHIVARTALQRRVIALGSAIAHAGYNEALDADALKDAVDRATADALEGVGTGSGFTRLADIVERMDARRWNDAERPAPIATGLGELDAKMGGLHRGDMTVVAGVSGHGKTSLLNTIAWHVAAHDTGVAYFSLEMKDERIHDRFLRLLTGIPFARLQLPGRTLRPDETDAIVNANGQMSAVPLHINDKRGQTVEELTRAIRQKCRHEAIGLVIVDYVQLVGTSRSGLGGRTEELDHIAYRLYDLAGELDVHVLCASQLVKEQFVSAPPTIDKVRGSGAIVHAANNVLFVWRDERVPDTGEAVKLTQVHIGKQREGELGAVNVGWYGERSMFVDVSQVKAVNNANGARERIPF